MAKHALVVPDVSSWNKGLTRKFERDFLIFRANDGLYQDPKFLSNANLAKILYGEGHFAGAACYSVYRPLSVTQQYNFFWKLIGPKIPDWLKGHMTDVESWGGAIKGDHSSAINSLVGMHAHKFGKWSSVLGYGNQSDLAALWKKRDKRIKVIVASYGPKLVYRNVSGAIGQQYTDGSGRWDAPAGLPIASAEFGRVDHNVFPAHTTGKQLAEFLRPTAKPTPKPAPKPAPKHAPPPKPKPKPLYAKGITRLTANGRAYEAVLGDNGHLRLFHRGDQVGEFQLVKSGSDSPNTPAK